MTTSVWTRYNKVDDVPVGDPLSYLTLLALRLGRLSPDLPVPVDPPLVQLAREPLAERWLSLDRMTLLAEEHGIRVVGEKGNYTAVVQHDSREFMTNHEFRLVVIARCLIHIGLGPTQLTVPTEMLHPTYEQWCNGLTSEWTFRAVMGGKSQTMSMLGMYNPFGVMLYQHQYRMSRATDEHPADPVPDGFVERLTQQVEEFKQARAAQRETDSTRIIRDLFDGGGSHSIPMFVDSCPDELSWRPPAGTQRGTVSPTGRIKRDHLPFGHSLQHWYDRLSGEKDDNGVRVGGLWPGQLSMTTWPTLETRDTGDKPACLFCKAGYETKKHRVYGIDPSLGESRMVAVDIETDQLRSTVTGVQTFSANAQGQIVADKPPRKPIEVVVVGGGSEHSSILAMLKRALEDDPGFGISVVDDGEYTHEILDGPMHRLFGQAPMMPTHMLVGGEMFEGIGRNDMVEYSGRAGRKQREQFGLDPYCNYRGNGNTHYFLPKDNQSKTKAKRKQAKAARKATKRNR